MKLHFRGIQVPALGSPRDLVYREYQLYESRLEAKKHKMLLLLTIGAPFFSEDSGRNEWNKQAKEAFDEYVMLMFGEETTPRKRQESDMLEFYEKTIKNSKPVMTGSSSKEGSLTVSNLPIL